MLLKNAKTILGFNDYLFVFAGVLINTHTVMAIYYTGAFFKVKFTDYLVTWFGEFLCILILWLVIRQLYLQLLKKFKGVQHIKKRLLIIPTFLIPYFFICFWYIKLIQPFFRLDHADFTDPNVAVQILTGAVIFFIDMGFYEALHLFVELKNTKIEEEIRKKESVTSQLLNLKNQISPHFLFNSLNTLVHLIDVDKEKSKEFVHKLASIYKTTLEISDQNLISLKDELRYINDYTDLLQERFGENVNFKIEINDCEKEKKLIPLSLQLAVENAVKHNIITTKHPLKINILTQNGYLVIKNNLQKKHSNGIQYGLGLKNIRKRYELLSNERVIIESGKVDFILKLPLLSE